jgi:hypothetical protein
VEETLSLIDSQILQYFRNLLIDANEEVSGTARGVFLQISKMIQKHTGSKFHQILSEVVTGMLRAEFRNSAINANGEVVQEDMVPPWMHPVAVSLLVCADLYLSRLQY